MAQLQWITPTGLIASYAEEGYLEYQLLAKYAAKEVLYYWDVRNGNAEWKTLQVDAEWDYSTLVTGVGPIQLVLKGAVKSEAELPAYGNAIGDGYMLDYNRKLGASGLTYKIISGKLGDGLQLSKDGLIQGVPVIEGPPTDATLFNYDQTFTVRVSDHKGNIADRTFKMSINSLANPQIIPKNISLGSYYDGYYLDLQLTAVYPNPTAPITWDIISGSLPNGVTLSTDGKIVGYIEPFYSPQNEYILGWSIPGWDYVPWDAPTAAAKSKTYRFTARVFDGSRYDLSTYSIDVQAKMSFTVDNDIILVDSTVLTTDLDNKHFPYITTLPQELGVQRQSSNFAFKFNGRDLDGEKIKYAVVLQNLTTFSEGPYDWDELPYVPGEARPGVGFDMASFDQLEQALPPGLSLDPDTGWLTGHIGTQIEERKTYTFQIYCYDVDYPERRSRFVTFTLTVLGELYNVITWLTPSDLGVIDNGAISELSISAVSSKGQKLIYRLKEPAMTPNILDPSETVVWYSTQARSKLPQGLTLLPNGLIVGRTTFEYFSIDNGSTTFDKNTVQFDNLYEFTVTAVDDRDPSIFINTGTVSDDKTFTVRVNNYNKTPFENVYLKALPSHTQRAEFVKLLGNTDIFPEQLMYRPADPWFGRARDIKFLFAAGMNPNLAATYIESMQHNHYTKRISLGEVKTAVSLDDNFKVKYEVVYVEVVDTLVNDHGRSIAKHIDRTGEVRTPYKTMPFTQIYPNSLDNMKSEIATLGYANRGAIPDWMLDPQEDGRVLGFTRGVVLAYTVPGASKLIAFRLAQYEAQFNAFDFVADRYQLDHTLTKNYDVAAHAFAGSKETTFDRLPQVGGVFLYAGTVDFALRMPFDEINGRPLSYVLGIGGFDGSKSIHSGQLVVFAQQEYYVPNNDFGYCKDPFDLNSFDLVDFDSSYVPYHYLSANDGWNIEGLWGSKPYATTAYAPAEIVPGYLEKLLYNSLLLSVDNRRGGIWRVVVTPEENVILEFIKEVPLNGYVLVSDGQTFGDTKIYYDPIIKPNRTVPEYSLLTTAARGSTELTRFDKGATRFYDSIDVFEMPETGDIYLKFPKYNIYS